MKADASHPGAVGRYGKEASPTGRGDCYDGNRVRLAMDLYRTAALSMQVKTLLLRKLLFFGLQIEEFLLQVKDKSGELLD